MDTALELMWLVESHIDWDQMQGELEEFSSIVGGHRMNVSNYREIFMATEDVRRDLLEQPNIKKVIGDMSNLLRQMSEQLTADAPEPASSNLTSSFNLLFSQNTSANSRMAFAAFQRVVCGRNMSSDQLFSDGGVANA